MLALSRVAMLVPLLCFEVAHAEPRVKVPVAETGLYEVTGRQLADLGLDLGALSAGALALTCGGQPVPLRVVGDGQAVTADTRLRFWGQAAESKFTRTNAYWLALNGAPKSMAAQEAVPNRGGEPVRAVRSRARFETNEQYAYLLLAPDKVQADHWLWHKVTAKQQAEVTFDLADPVADGQAAIWVELRGSTATAEQPDHHTVIQVNGQVVEDAQWDGATLRRFEGPLPPGLLKPAGNVLMLASPGDTPAGDVDTVYLNAFEVTYDRAPIARDGQLVFSLGPGPAPQLVEIAGLDGSADLYDITDPATPAVVSATVGGNGVLQATVAYEAERRLAAVSDAAVKRPQVALAEDSGLRSAENGADYLVIADEALIPPLEPLLELRRKQGLRVAVAPVHAVYDDFGDGLATPLAIREFVRYAVANWQRPAPKFLFLVGDASYDYLDCLGTGVANQVPTYLVTVGFNIETPDDDWFACLNDTTHEPALAVGRLPARTPQDVEAYVGKVVAYEALGAEDWQKRFVMLADHDLPNDAEGPYETFQKGLADRLRGKGYTADLLALRSVMHAAPPGKVRPDLTDRVTEAIDAGCAVLLYQGHGDEFYWSRERVLTLEDAFALTNGTRLPMVVEVSCFTGAFDSPDVKHPSCVAEAFLLNPNGGAIACFSAARLGGTNLDDPFIEALTRNPAPTIGEAFRHAKSAPGLGQGELWELQATYNLLGDPALHLKLPPPAQ